jgi:mono/diheme cytochrome c family protein/glucose/arabinose dehydrogenase
MDTRRARLAASVLVAVTTAVAGDEEGWPSATAARPLSGGQLRSPSSRPWPPRVVETSSESPALPPADALKTFHLPPGYFLELAAAEPLVQDPVALDWDPDGRLWVVEMPGYMRDIAGRDERDRIGRVVVLEDENGDGRMDRRDVFADGLVMPRAVKVLAHGVLVGEPPNVWLMRDTNGDRRVDTRELVTNQYGRLEIDPQNNANALYWALDNAIHVAGQADIALRLRRGAFEVRRTLRRGQWGVTEDDAGRLYRNTNESALHVDVVPTAYFARNANLLRTRGSYERLADDTPELNTVWPARRTPGTNRAYQLGILRSDGSLARFTAVCAPLIYRGDRLPADLYGNAFVAEPAGNLVARIVLDDEGPTVRARKAYERGEFVASTDERFRPVFLSNAPDGTLYIVDMYRGVLEHRLSMTEYLRDQILTRRLVEPIGMGRIYRVMHETTRRDTTPLGTTASSEQLVGLLSHPNGWRRDTAQRLLVERVASRTDPPASANADRSVVSALTALASSAPHWRTRLHALWTLDGRDAIDPMVVARALEDSSRDVRVAGLRLAERWLAEPDHPIQEAVLRRMEDTHWAVRRQLAASLGALPVNRRVPSLGALLAAFGDDAIIVDAALSGLRGNEAGALVHLLARGGPRTPQVDASITMLAATVVRSAQNDDLQGVFATIADQQRAWWQRSALLRGAEVALVGAAMPGTPAPRLVESSPPQPCPTCAGARSGPGGAYAYPRPVVAAEATRRTGLRLTREPTAFAALAAGTSGLGPRIASVLTRISWPGKAGDVSLPPLSPADQQRFDAGREVYRNICQACHQPDGRGQDGVAPTLIESAWTLAPPDIPARILLSGKEGRIGLMPAIGATLDDEMIASVLTYIRREWGHAGTPVGAATVRAVRALTSDRTRPWTDDELGKLAGLRE